MSFNQNEYLRIYRNTPQYKLKLKIKQQNIKIEVLSYYGDGKCTCTFCGYDDIRALTIDHINGDGCEKRKECYLGGIHLYRWLKKKNYPIGYQTLCMNCQFIKKMRNKEL